MIPALCMIIIFAVVGSDEGYFNYDIAHFVILNSTIFILFNQTFTKREGQE